MGKKKKDGKLKCFLYKRVSTGMQVEGYSLDAQDKKLRDYAAYRGMEIVGDYKDEGVSGTRIKGREDFQRMLQAIQDGADVDYVLVFKLSRFGRNAADVLNSVQLMQDYGVELACTDDGIDTAQGAGKLIVAVLASVAEIERENILAQTMAGREQKAREGRWNGGFAPYGYKLVDGELQIAEDEIDIIKLIFDLYVHEPYGIAGVTKYLNTHGYQKKVRGNAKLTSFSTGFVKGVLDNPVYCGKIAFGRRRVEKIAGSERDKHIVRQSEYNVYEGLHEAIVSEDLWNEAQKKRSETGHKTEKFINKDRVHLLSGLLKCPVCGAGMYGNMNRKKKRGDEYYTPNYFYACKHRLNVGGHKCDYHHQWNEEEVNKQVLDVVVKVLDDDMLKEKMIEWFGLDIDDSDLRKNIEKLTLTIANKRKRISKLGQQQDQLSLDDPMYDEKFDELQKRIDGFYDDIVHLGKEQANLEQQLDEENKEKARRNMMSAEAYVEAYKALLPFGISEAVDRDMLRSLIDKIEIFKERQEDGRIVKKIWFKAPIDLNEETIAELRENGWDYESSVECVCLLSLGSSAAAPV